MTLVCAPMHGANERTAAALGASSEQISDRCPASVPRGAHLVCTPPKAHKLLKDLIGAPQPFRMKATHFDMKRQRPGDERGSGDRATMLRHQDALPTLQLLGDSPVRRGANVSRTLRVAAMRLVLPTSPRLTATCPDDGATGQQGDPDPPPSPAQAEIVNTVPSRWSIGLTPVATTIQMTTCDGTTCVGNANCELPPHRFRPTPSRPMPPPPVEEAPAD